MFLKYHLNSPWGYTTHGISCISNTSFGYGSSHQWFTEISMGIQNAMIPLFKLDSIFSLSVPENWGIPGIIFRRGWPMVFSGTGLVIKLQSPLGTLFSESECRSSVLGLKTTKSAPLIHCTCLSTTVISLHVITTGLHNKLLIFSMAIPISSAKMPAANVAKKLVSLRAYNLFGSMFVHPVLTPFVTSSLQRACSKISFPSINMNTINVVFASVGMAL